MKQKKRREERGKSALNSKSGSEQLEKRKSEHLTNIKGQKYLETEDRETKDGEIFAERVLKPFPAGF